MRPMIERSGAAMAMSVCLAAGLPALAQPICAWEFVPAPGVGSELNVLFGAGASPAGGLWAVGRSDFAAGTPRQRTLAMRFDGASWVVTPTPSPSSPFNFNELRAVLPISASDALAVGSFVPPAGGRAQALTLRWNGSSWSQTAGLSIGNGSALFDIAQIGSEIWAVGSRGSPRTAPAGTPPLAARWTGSSWQTVDVPNPSCGTAGEAVLFGVSGVATNDIWAVGRFDFFCAGNFSPSNILIARYSGAAWSIVPIQTPGVSDTLQDVEMVSASDGWAVGFTTDAASRIEPLIYRYDGTAWVRTALPTFGQGGAELRSVIARSASEVYAAGSWFTQGGVPRPLIMRFDGTRWAIMNAATVPQGGGERLWALALADAAAPVWAVGEYASGLSNDPPLTERLGVCVYCPTDVNGDSVVDVNDFFAFLTIYADNNPRADVTGDGQVNVDDFFGYLTLYAAGC